MKQTILTLTIFLAVTASAKASQWPEIENPTERLAACIQHNCVQPDNTYSDSCAQFCLNTVKCQEHRHCTPQDYSDYCLCAE